MPTPTTPISQSKLASLRTHLDQTYFVFDFDGTLTQRSDEHGKVRPSIISLLRDEGALNEDYAQQDQDDVRDNYLLNKHEIKTIRYTNDQVEKSL